MDDEVIATIEVSQMRRWVALAMLLALALVLLYTALTSAPSVGWRVFLLAAGGGCLWMAMQMQSATRHRIELTDHELRDSSGTRLALVADIVRVESGMAAFRPSNGFVVHTARPLARAWMPGLWWRVGRRVGIGGVTPGAQTKFMSNQLALRLAARDQFDAKIT